MYTPVRKIQSITNDSVNQWVKNETANSQDFQLYNLSQGYVEQLRNLAFPLS